MGNETNCHTKRSLKRNKFRSGEWFEITKVKKLQKKIQFITNENEENLQSNTSTCDFF